MLQQDDVDHERDGEREKLDLAGKEKEIKHGLGDVLLVDNFDLHFLHTPTSE